MAARKLSVKEQPALDLLITYKKKKKKKEEEEEEEEERINGPNLRLRVLSWHIIC